jgi:hypothetical protein
MALPLIAKQGESQSASLPTQPPAILPSRLLPAAVTTQPPDLSVRFAVIGDYGRGGAPEADVASLVASWQPDLVITVGDNNYPRRRG